MIRLPLKKWLANIHQARQHKWVSWFAYSSQIRAHKIEMAQTEVLGLKENVNMSQFTLYTQDSRGSMCPRISRIHLRQSYVVTRIHICLKSSD